jgi:hypothetical protein
MRLHHSPDASTFPRLKQICFVNIICFWKVYTALAFNQYTCSHLALYLHVMPPHCSFHKLFYIWYYVVSLSIVQYLFGIAKCRVGIA